MPSLPFKKAIILFIAVLVSVVCFAQRGGGGGGMGGQRGGGGMGGQRGGGFSSGMGGWGSYSTLNDSTDLARYSGSLTYTEGRGSGSAIRENDLKELLDSIQFQRYEIANRQFIKGDNKQSIGVLCGIPTAILTLIAVTHYDSDDPTLSKKLYILSGALAVPTITFYTWGWFQKGKAKRNIESIADEYNKELELKRAAKMLQFEFEPTVFIDRENNSSFGMSVNLTF